MTALVQAAAVFQMQPVSAFEAVAIFSLIGLTLSRRGTFGFVES